MADPFTGYPLRADYTNETKREDIHPAAHNDVARAANELQEQMDALPEEFAARSSTTPIVRVKADADLALASGAPNTGIWRDIDPGGTTAARPLDVVIPNVEAGQWVTYEPCFNSSSTTAGIFLDVVTVVAGAKVNHFGDPVGGTMGWFLPASTARCVTGGRSYQVQAGDIEDGAVRLRMQSKNSGAAARAISGSGGFTAAFEGRGPFG